MHAEQVELHSTILKGPRENTAVRDWTGYNRSGPSHLVAAAFLFDGHKGYQSTLEME